MLHKFKEMMRWRAWNGLPAHETVAILGLPQSGKSFVARALQRWLTTHYNLPPETVSCRLLNGGRSRFNNLLSESLLFHHRWQAAAEQSQFAVFNIVEDLPHSPWWFPNLYESPTEDWVAWHQHMPHAAYDWGIVVESSEQDYPQRCQILDREIELALATHHAMPLEHSWRGNFDDEHVDHLMLPWCDYETLGTLFEASVGRRLERRWSQIEGMVPTLS